MWKEFTQEKPARRGWTVATLSLAFIGTVGLAKIMVDVRADNTSVVSGEQSPPEWPFDFTLPTDHRWRLNPDLSAQSGNEASTNESVAFDGRSRTGVYCLLWVSYETLPPGTRPEEIAGALAEGNPGVAEEVSMGPIDGQLTVIPSAMGGVRVLAIGCTPEGLTLVVAHDTPRRTGEEVAIVRAVCKSIEFKEWRSRR